MIKHLFAACAVLLTTIGASAQVPQLTMEDLLSTNVRGGGEGLLSPDGKYFAKTEQGRIIVTAAAGGNERVVLATPSSKSELAWSHDTKRLSCGRLREARGNGQQRKHYSR